MDSYDIKEYLDHTFKPLDNGWYDASEIISRYLNKKVKFRFRPKYDNSFVVSKTIISPSGEIEVKLLNLYLTCTKDNEVAFVPIEVDTDLPIKTINSCLYTIQSYSIINGLKGIALTNIEDEVSYFGSEIIEDDQSANKNKTESENTKHRNNYDEKEKGIIVNYACDTINVAPGKIEGLDIGKRGKYEVIIGLKYNKYKRLQTIPKKSGETIGIELLNNINDNIKNTIRKLIKSQWVDLNYVKSNIEDETLLKLIEAYHKYSLVIKKSDDLHLEGGELGYFGFILVDIGDYFICAVRKHIEDIMKLIYAIENGMAKKLQTVSEKKLVSEAIKKAIKHKKIDVTNSVRKYDFSTAKAYLTFYPDKFKIILKSGNRINLFKDQYFNWVRGIHLLCVNVKDDYYLVAVRVKLDKYPSNEIIDRLEDIISYSYPVR